MIKVQIDSQNTQDYLLKVKEIFNCSIERQWGEYNLTIDNTKARGTIRFISFDWGVSLLNYNITFFEETTLIVDASIYNPINFIYSLNGTCEHRFNKDLEKKELEQFQSVIVSSKDGSNNYWYFPKNKKLEINFIQIRRKKFLKKRLNSVDSLNAKLYEVFMDTDYENTFRYFGTFNLKMADRINELRSMKSKGMIKVLRLEGLTYQILSMHIQQHDRALNKNRLPTSLTKKELAITHKLAKNILKDVSKEYSLDALTEASGLSQAKLQEGFKLLYARTVTEYIRHARLELARELMNTSDLNISEIVYSIGFSSRSYFSKIFREKYNLSPSEFIKFLKLPTTSEN